MRFVSFLEQTDKDNLDSNLVSNIEKIDQNVIDSWATEAEEIKKMTSIFASNIETEKLIKFYGILKSNSYMIKNDQDGRCIGAQLIDLHSLVNHSCEPNCVSSYDGTNVYMIALKDISSGEEITVSYTDTAKSRNIRKQFLNENLFFDCQCNLCSSDEFSSPEALRTAVLCKCGQGIYGNYLL